MKRRLLLPLLAALTLPGCEGLPGLSSTDGNRNRIVITAQSGSEVVLTKNVGGPSVANDANAPGLADFEDSLRVAPLPDAALEQVDPIRERTDPPPIQRNPVQRLGTVRAKPWRVQPGETLFDAVSRFAERAGRTAQKPEPFPIWEITSEASFSGEFEGALQWLMAGFGHTSPRPFLNLHPNGVVRLSAE